MSVPDPPDRGYDEQRARVVLDGLIGSAVIGTRIITLDQLRTSADGCDIQADLAIELELDQRARTPSRSFPGA